MFASLWWLSGARDTKKTRASGDEWPKGKWEINEICHSERMETEYMDRNVLGYTSDRSRQILVVFKTGFGCFMKVQVHHGGWSSRFVVSSLINARKAERIHKLWRSAPLGTECRISNFLRRGAHFHSSAAGCEEGVGWDFRLQLETQLETQLERRRHVKG